MNPGERWQQIAGQSRIPEGKRPALLEALAAGATVAEAAGVLAVTKWTARTCLEELRAEGSAAPCGPRWHLTGPAAEAS
jgi:predicted ArsR family transcriptional regulator